MAGAGYFISKATRPKANKEQDSRPVDGVVVDNGGIGSVYWEPAWVSTKCSTRWGQGSNWDNATFFDFTKGNEALPAFDFLTHPYRRP